jgi:hypothetical protein
MRSPILADEARALADLLRLNGRVRLADVPQHVRTELVREGLAWTSGSSIRITFRGMGGWPIAPRKTTGFFLPTAH